MRVLHLMSCRGWSSDAYWAARVAVEMERAGHEVTLCCRAGTEARVISRARELGATRIETLGLRSGLRPHDDLSDLRRLGDWLPQVDVLHVHRGKEHWLAALANRLSKRPRPLIRTRHIVQAVRPHAANRWLYRTATDLVVTVTEAIRRQYVASGLLPAEKVITLPGGVDVEQFHPRLDGSAARAALGIPDDALLVGLVSGLRVMKGHTVVVEAAARLAQDGIHPHLLFIGRGSMEERIRENIRRASLDGQVKLVGFVRDLPAAMSALDIALYVPLESDGMGRVVFECLALGRPLVASRVGVVPEVLGDGRDALLVPPGDPGLLAEAIRRLVADPGLRTALGVAGRRLVVERYSGACVAARLADLYAGLLARQAS
ncbi:MAG: glycosyltransferase family 4 protein [Candidatus Rokubacteria bacterium]|nr:glycosyltransferase family 4 protein [Candidatus Rokubacteria bacterium]